jgi:hypothetical protein
VVERAAGQTVEVETRPPAGLPPAQVDANQMELAAPELAVNARATLAQLGAAETATAAWLPRLAKSHRHEEPALLRGVVQAEAA